jgi:hypothetical protein
VSAHRRVLRFRATGSEGALVSTSGTVLAVTLDDSPVPVGHIVQLPATPEVAARWAYMLNDGRATGLQSTLSRHDLEGQIIEYYFQDLIADHRHSA